MVSKINKSTGRRLYNREFVNTDYYKFYNSLINDNRLLECMKKHGYKGKFLPHPNMLAQIKDFNKNDVFTIDNTTINYSKEFKVNSLLVTDYSSIFFDFAYLKKPIIYSQFDKTAFFDQQVYDEGYFDYERDGFGPVCEDYESTVKTLIEYINNDCKLNNKYMTRIKNFFSFNDKNNRMRVLKEILKLDK